MKAPVRSIATLLLFALGGTVVSGCRMAAQWDNMQGKQAFEAARYDEAIKSFQTALNRNPNDASAYYNLAATYQMLGKQSRNPQMFATAEQMYNRSIALDPRYTDAHRGLAVLLCETGRTDAAFDLMKTWQARTPTSADPYIELARLYQEHGDRNQAIQNLTSALALDASNARALTAMATIREQNGELQLALDNYLRAYQDSPNQPAVAAKIAQLQQQLQLPISSPTNTAPTRWGAANPYVPR
jgi:tetratricopeptide (TPR) repeat protein